MRPLKSELVHELRGLAVHRDPLETSSLTSSFQAEKPVGAWKVTRPVFAEIAMCSAVMSE